MRKSTTIFITFLLGIALYLNFSLPFTFVESFKSWAFNKTETKDPASTVQIALLLDTSSSMSGLIEQAKSQLWKIVNELNNAEHSNQTPNLEIALYEYGNSRLAQSTGYIEQVVPFTRDMDLVSEHLFALTTNGGDEYCGQVINTALEDLQWSPKSSDLKLIYIAGNESFNQGSFPFSTACKKAKDRDVIVNTIFCGDQKQGLEMAWNQGATQGGGNFMNIDQNSVTKYIDTPFDDQIATLNDELNNTYISYGKRGAELKGNQTKQDSNASSYSKANKVDRAVFKSSKNYDNEKWDYVDAYKKNKKILKDKSKTPAAFRGKSKEEIEKLVQQKATERKRIQNQIKTLDKDRRGYIAKEKSKMAKEDTSLESSVVATVKDQARKKGYKFKK